MRAVIIDEASGEVVNVTILPAGWTGQEDEWRPDEGFVAIPHAVADMGWSLVGGELVAPPSPPAPDTPPPASITPRQFRLALLQAELLDAVEAVMAAPATPRALRIEWEYASEIRLDHPAWEAMLIQMGKDRGDLDDLFRAGVLL